MQPSLVTPVERPLRRVSSSRTTLETQQSAGSGDCFSVISDRGDGKLLERSNSQYVLAQVVRGGGGEMGSIHESDYGTDAAGFPLHKRSYSGDLGIKKNRTVVTYCLGAILSLFLLVQIFSGGFGLFSPTSALCGMKQMPYIFEKNQVMEERLNRVGSWKPMTYSVKENKDSSHVPTSSSQPQHQSVNDNTVGSALYSSKDEGQTFQYIEKPREKDDRQDNSVTDNPQQRQSSGIDQSMRNESDRRNSAERNSAGVAQSNSKSVVVQDDGRRSNLDSTSLVQQSSLRARIKTESSEVQPTTTDSAAATQTDTSSVKEQQEQSTSLEEVEVKPQEDSWYMRPAYNYQQCIEEGPNHQKPQQATDGYLLTFANGGLNQMRTAICDMVAVARVMNATLVIPELDHTSYWADPSQFGDVFDVEKFITLLQDDVRIVRELPSELRALPVYEMAPRSWSEIPYYEETVAPLLKQHKVVRFILTDSRLANNRIPEEVQRLRCKANYRALKFQPSIEDLGQKIISRLRVKGPYIAMHLRFEKDMLAFSGCTFGLSAEEAEELRVIRYNVSRWKEKEIDPVMRRAEGGCPLTPHEIGLMLRAMGYPRKTMIYVASGQIYGGEERMKDFTSLFPNVVTKETIATPEEMQQFSDYQNRLAAIDYMVAVDADVFVPSYEGNMARAVQGHRRFNGHKITLIPDRVELVKLLDQYQSGEIDWSQLQKAVVRTHRNRQGSPHVRKSLSPSRAKLEENFYANPLPGCICEVGSGTQ
ncbi:hypothetical protein R1sor_019644 [Riccia sorocarpa]|uniref:O-fucosyltransferase family protein n=1 Tax=Riccia sorocarpa TaxID=122646 RepID=A0ABD3IHF6_9MARC